MDVLSVVGARPQFVKLAPISQEFARRGIRHAVVHTGQHYDPAMSEALVSSLGLPEPDANLRIGSGTHAAQTGAMLAALENEFVQRAPDWVLIYGDTNSTLAAAIAAVKLGLPVAHLEAGLRSGNRAMPEEHNRVLSDHAADLLLAPTANAVAQLASEGLAERTVLVGDVMADICLAIARMPAPAPARSLLGAPYLLATLHRPYNTDDPQRLSKLIAALAASPIPVILPVHPRLRTQARAQGLGLDQGSIRPVDPVGYPTMVHIAKGARAIITDSGGLQKEAYLLGVPCTTVRPETEWTETLGGGWNMVVFADVASVLDTALRPLPEAPRAPHFGQGHAAAAVAAALQARTRPRA